MTRAIQLLFRGAVHSVTPSSIQRTALQWLREDVRACGTKEGCNEGDCGACTVVVADLDVAGELRLSAINACLQLLPALDRKALLTVEDLQTLMPTGQLHPVQQAMVDGHGSQCGFCTPGFVMSLFASYEVRPQAPSRAQIEDVLSGNLCRCTGYRPIIDAATAAYQLPRVTLDRARLMSQLQDMQSLPDLEVQVDDVRWFAPTSVNALAELLLERPSARLVAGTTDVGLWVTKQLRDLGDLISVMSVAEMRQIERRESVLHFGAAASLQDCFQLLIDEFPEWTELARRFASLPIRNAGTLGGNVANGSPIGDSMPGLIALGATVLLRRGVETRSLALEDFYLAYQKNALQSGEFLEAVQVPRRQHGQVVSFHKVSKRFDQDISAVCLGLSYVLVDGHIEAPRLAYGGMAAVCKRAPAAEAALAGASCDSESFERAAQAVAGDFTPLSDARASADYRRKIAANLLRRCASELNPMADAIPLRLLDAEPVSTQM